MRSVLGMTSASNRPDSEQGLDFIHPLLKVVTGVKQVVDAVRRKRSLSGMASQRHHWSPLVLTSAACTRHLKRLESSDYRRPECRLGVVTDRSSKVPLVSGSGGNSGH